MASAAKKKIVFYDTDKRHAKLKIRLHYDGLTQSGFFRAMVSGYLDKDPALLDFINRLQEKENIHSVRKRDTSDKLLESGEEVKKKFSLLGEDEVESIFDMIEKEHPEL
tara:strand:+ start:535 stop:861 length:327 start_codon:yes stop_codon:yes gene_type:complete